MSRASGTSASKPGVPGGTIRAMGCWCPVGTVKHRPRRQPRPAATAAPVPTVSARPRRRRVKVFSQVFFKKLAGCRAEPYGPKGVARTVGPAFPYSKKRGDVCPPIVLPQRAGTGHRISWGAYYGKENPKRRRYYGRKRMRARLRLPGLF